MAFVAMFFQSGSIASAQGDIYFHGDFKSHNLNPNGGSFYGNLIQAYGYQVQLTYPAGGPATTTDIINHPLNTSQPPGFSEVRLNLLFMLGVSDPGFVFKGTSTLKFTLPSSITNGTTMKLALWSADSSGTVTYGNVLSGVSSNRCVSFAIQNMTMPKYYTLGFTLGS